MTAVQKNPGFSQVIESLSRSMGNLAEPLEQDHNYDTVPEEPNYADPPESPQSQGGVQSQGGMRRQNSYRNETYVNINRIQKGE